VIHAEPFAYHPDLRESIDQHPAEPRPQPVKPVLSLPEAYHRKQTVQVPEQKTHRPNGNKQK